MCAIIDLWTTARFKKRKRKKFIAYKVLDHQGCSLYGQYSYGPGTHELPYRMIYTTDYDSAYPRGFHVYLYKKTAKLLRNDAQVIIPVQCDVRDVIGIEKAEYSTYRECVLNKIKILKKDWKQAFGKQK